MDMYKAKRNECQKYLRGNELEQDGEADGDVTWSISNRNWALRIR